MPEKCGAVLPLDIQVESLLGCPIYLLWWTSHSLCLKPQRENPSLVCTESILKIEKEDFSVFFFFPYGHTSRYMASLIAQLVKNLPAIQDTPGSTPGSGRSSGEGIGYPLQYSWVSLVAQLVKNLPAMRETWV